MITEVLASLHKEYYTCSLKLNAVMLTLPHTLLYPPPLLPPHQDKVLLSMGPHNEGVQVTNDGATILKSIGVDNPAAKVLVGKCTCDLQIVVLSLL